MLTDILMGSMGRDRTSPRLQHLWRIAAWSLLGVLTSVVPVQRGLAQYPASAAKVTLGARSAARARRFLRGRTVQGGGSAAQAYKMARRQAAAMLALPRAANLSLGWMQVGPAQVANPVYGSVTGRVTAIAVDPADATGNTVYVGTTGGGVWKSTNAAGPVGAVMFVPLTDTLPVFDQSAGSSATPSLSIGSLAIGNGVLLAGTGDPNDATDSYYGSGILRSADGGLTWTLAQQSNDGAGGNHSFIGLSVAGLAFSTANSNVVVAALASAAEGADVNSANGSSEMGLYVSNDAGLTWQMATIEDGSQVVQDGAYTLGLGGGNAATSVVWNALRQEFLAAVRYHGYYTSPDGVTWTRLAQQPGMGLTPAACPTNPGGTGNPSCPIFRGALAVQPLSGDTFALTVDANNLDQGLYQDVCGPARGSCQNVTVLFGSHLNGAPLEVGSGNTEILQGDYNLTLAAAASGTDTLLYIGTIDLYRCSLAAGCVLRDTTNAQNGCATPAGVAGAQHAIAAGGSNEPLYLGNDGGLWRSTDGVAETGGVCSPSDAAHFDNLNNGLGSLAEVVSFAQDPVNAATLLTGLGALGSAGTGTASGAWPQMSTGEGGTVAIDPVNPLNWYVATGAGVNIAACAKGSACGLGDFATTAIGATQVDGDEAEIDTPWMLDPAMSNELLLGTCRAWRGPAVGGAAWTGGDLLSGPFAANATSGCGASFALVRSLGAGGAANTTANAPNVGSEVLYAGIEGSVDGAIGVYGHLFTTAAGDTANGSTAWTDIALSPVTNELSEGGVFNPGAFDVSSISDDAHDSTGATVYATVMGFAGNGINAAHVYRSSDQGAHWTNISANLPNAPANGVIVDPNDANTVYVALDTGVYVTTAVTTCVSANCWSAYGISLPNAPVTSLVAAGAMATGDGRFGELRAGTYGRGIWTIPLVTAVAPAAPAITLNPTSETFPNQQVGTQSTSMPVTVTNSGNATLSVTSVTASGDFVESDNCVGVPVAPSATCVVQVTFAPTATGTRTGSLTVYGNVTGGQATAALSGVGTAPAAIVLDPSTLSFPSTTIGATSAAENITISNTGGSTSALQSVTLAGQFSIAANTCGTLLAPGTGCTVSIVFAPTASGTQNGTLTVVDDVGTQAASLTGSGTSPATDALAPLSLNFAAQQVTTASPPQQVTLTNAGDQALTLIAAQASGDFSVVNGCGASLAGHSSCALSVTFIPKIVGAETGALTVADEFRSQIVSLSGIGVAPPGVSLLPAGGLTFPATAVGSTAAQQAVTLTNNGGLPLLLSGMTTTGDFFISANACGNSVAAASACTVQVSFAPTLAGARTGQLVFTDNAASSSQQILSLNGTGIDFSLAGDGPLTMTVASGQNVTYLLLLNSVAGVPGSAAFTCSGVPVNALCTVSPATAPLYVTGGTVVTVTLATGDANASLQRPEMSWNKRLAWLALMLPLGLALRRRRAMMTVLLGAALTLGAGGCATVSRTIPQGGGGGGTPVVTPSGSYTIVVAGSSAGVVRAVDLTLIVQ